MPISLRRRLFGYGKSKEEQEAKARDEQQKLVEQARQADYRDTLAAERHRARIEAAKNIARAEANREVKNIIKGGGKPGVFHRVVGEPFFFKQKSPSSAPKKKSKSTQQPIISKMDSSSKKKKKSVRSHAPDYTRWMP